jgi:opacity protein-like surface antigen
VANATPKEKLTMRTTNFSKEIVCAISAAVVGMFLTFTAPDAQGGPFKNVVPTVTTETEYLWSGPYLALDAGAVWTNFDISDYSSRVNLTTQFNEAIGAVPLSTSGGVVVSPPPATTGPIDIFFDEPGHESTSAAVIGGADLGYNFQFGHFVVGPVIGFSGTRTTDGSLVRDFQGNDFTITNVPTTPPPGVNNSTAAFEDTRFTAFRRAEQNWNGYAGVQAGFAWRRLFFYATGGSAFSQIDVRTRDQAVTRFFDANDTLMFKEVDNAPAHSFHDAVNNVLTGWYVGAGTQFAVTDAVRAGIEYRHNDYGDRLYHFTDSAPFHAVHPGATRVDVSNNEVFFKVSIMLGRLTKAAK